MRRTDEHGRAFKGSQLQMQIYANRRREVLDAALRAKIEELNDHEIVWLAPLESKRFDEPRDHEFLEVCGVSVIMQWHWTIRRKHRQLCGTGWRRSAHEEQTAGVLFLEGKSYPGELKSACHATSPKSRRQIENAIVATRALLNARGSARPWLETYYQLANRLAHAAWLRGRGVHAWLVLLHFADYLDHVQTSESAWEQAMHTPGERLGVDLRTVPWVVHLTLPAHRASELHGIRNARG